MGKSVLILQPGFLGDAVLATGMVRALRTLDASVRIGMLIRREYASVLNGHVVDAVIELDKKQSGGTSEAIGRIREHRFDIALIPHRALRTGLIAFRANIPERVGFRQSDASILLTKRVPYDISKHELLRNRDLLQAAMPDLPNISAADCSGYLVPESGHRDAMVRRFGERSGTIAVAPGSVWPTKRWPAEYMMQLASELRTKGYRVLLIGSPGERELCESIAGAAGVPAEDVLAGKLGLDELVALCSVVERLVTNDSAPLHIAEAVGTPVSALFGPTVPAFGFAPYLPASEALEAGPLPCRPCGIHGHRECPVGTHECMTAIRPHDVLATLNGEYSEARTGE